MKRCVNARCNAEGKAVQDDSNKFCHECGGVNFVPVEEATDTNTVQGGIKFGEKNLVTADEIINHKQEVHAENYNVYHQNQPEQFIYCAVSGEKVPQKESVICTACKKEVSPKYYNHRCQICTHCENEQIYTLFVEEQLGGGTIISAATREVLDQKAEELKIDRLLKASIEKKVKEKNQKSGKKDLSENQKIELNIAIEQILKGGNLQSNFVTLESLFRISKSNEKVQFWYFLLKSALTPEEAIQHFKRKEVDFYWQHYWLFLAYLKQQRSPEAGNIIDDNRRHFPDLSDEITLAEATLRLYREIEIGSETFFPEVKRKISGIRYINPLLSDLKNSVEFVLSNKDRLDPKRMQPTVAFYASNVIGVPEVKKVVSPPLNLDHIKIKESAPVKSKVDLVAEKKAQVELERLELEAKRDRIKYEKEIEEIKSTTTKPFAPVYPVAPPKPTNTFNKKMIVYAGIAIGVLALGLFIFKDQGQETEINRVQTVQQEVAAEPKTEEKSGSTKETQAPSSGSGQAKTSQQATATTKTTQQSAAKETPDTQKTASTSSTQKEPATTATRSQTEQPKNNPPATQTQPQVTQPVTTAPATPAELYNAGLKQYKQFNYDQAYSYFQKAANQGEVNAQYYLGMMLLNGNGIAKNPETAFTYISQAANKGHKDAIYQLAQMYDGGLGTTKDKNKAKTWYQKAADQGNAAARRRLNNM